MQRLQELVPGVLIAAAGFSATTSTGGVPAGHGVLVAGDMLSDVGIPLLDMAAALRYV